jgi:hypothetical protein
MSPRVKRHTKHSVRSAVDTKVPGEHRSGREEIYWVVLENRKRFKVRLPKGRGKWGIGFQESVRKDLQLSHADFDDLVDCALTGREYEELLLEKLSQGLI